MKIIVFSMLCNLLLLQSCSKDNKAGMEREKFSYEVAATAPEEYPCEVHIGYLGDKNKKLISGIPKTGVLRAGWLFSGSKGAMGGDEIPSYIDLIYVAYAEKKFYRLEAELPREKILEAFRKGFLIETNKKKEDGTYELQRTTYNTLTIALAPGGMVVVFLGGGSRTEICRLQAKEVFVDKNEFVPHPDPSEDQQQFFDIGFKYAVPDSIQARIKEKGIPYGLYDQYRKKYKYRFLFMPYDEKDVIESELDKYYNGEITDFLEPEEIAKKEYKDQGIPYKVSFYFKKHSTEIVFNDQEMLSVFEALQKKHPGVPMDILLKPTFEYQDFKLSVQCGDEIVPLTKYKVKGVWTW